MVQTDIIGNARPAKRRLREGADYEEAGACSWIYEVPCIFPHYVKMRHIENKIHMPTDIFKKLNLRKLINLKIGFAILSLKT